MRIKLYLDEDAQRTSLAQSLRQHGVDVLTTSEAEQISKSDQSQLAFAASIGRTIYTYNVGDFMALHSKYLTLETKHSGIIIGEQGRFGVGEQMRRLLRIVEAKSAEELENHIEFLSNW
ncbi:MAG: DUF5615 family PIN-like protein [Pyrinomonadaceae bacterium]|nr:DUF5615 family PIN-like protein [Pyrinomonadaceae bacterium]